MSRRAVAVSAVALLSALVLAGAAWLVFSSGGGRRQDPPTRRGPPRSARAGAGAGEEAPSFAARAVAATPRGELTVRGTVLGPEGPVAGASVVATGAAEELLSRLRCRCVCHDPCDRRLLESGCSDAVAQVVELAAERRGEAPPLAYATSGADGSFELSGLAEGELAIWAEESTAGIGVRAGVHPGDSGADVTLAAGMLLEGQTITDGGIPVPGALVTAIDVERGRFYEALTGPDGRFRIGPVPSGKYPLVAAADGLLPAEAWANRGALGTLTLELPGPRTIRGRVLSGGAPAPGITVGLEGEQHELDTSTGADGAFRFEALRRGPYVLVAGAGLRVAFAKIWIEPGQDPEELVLELADGGSVDGSISDEGGAPIAGAELTIDRGEGGPQAAKSAADGSFHLAPVPAGSHTLRVEAKGFVKQTVEELQVIPGGAAELHVDLKRAARLAGHIVAPDGAPVGGAWVRATRVRSATPGPPDPGFWGGSDSDTTGADGSFVLELLPGSTFEVTVEHDEFVSHKGAFRPPDGAIRIILARGGEVTGTVVDGDALPVAGARLELLSEGPEHADVRQMKIGDADDLGAFRLRGVADGSYSLRASLGRYRGPGRVSKPSPVEVRHGKAPQVVLTLVAGLPISGRVLDATGNPVARARVIAAASAGGPGSGAGSSRLRSWDDEDARGTTSGDDGSFVLEELERGTYTLHATKRGHDDPGPDRLVHAEAGDSGVTLVLDAQAHVQGRVVREDGTPLASFEIDREPIRDPGGKFDVPVRGDEEVELEVTARGFATATRLVTVPEGGLVTLDDIVLGAGRALHGQLVDADSHAPVPGARIWFQPGDDPDAPQRGFLARDEGARTISDVGGRFRLGGVPDEPGRIWVDHAPQHAPLRLVVPPGDDLGTLLLDPGGAITGKLLLADGSAARTASLSASGPVNRRVTTGPDGRFELGGLPPGAYALEGDSAGNEDSARALVRLPPRGAVEVTLRPPAGGTTLTLRIRDATGATPDLSAGLVSGDVPAPTRLSDLIALTGDVREAHETASGELVAQHVAPGRHTLFVLVHQRGKSAGVHRQLVDVGDSPGQLDVRLPAELPSLSLR